MICVRAVRPIVRGGLLPGASTIQTSRGLLVFGYLLDLMVHNFADHDS